MKLRCTENSIRLRLRKSDVDKLAHEKIVSVPIGFPKGAFLKYELRLVTDTAIEAEVAEVARLPGRLATYFWSAKVVAKGPPVLKRSQKAEETARSAPMRPSRLKWPGCSGAWPLIPGVRT